MKSQSKQYDQTIVIECPCPELLTPEIVDEYRLELHKAADTWANDWNRDHCVQTVAFHTVRFEPPSVRVSWWRAFVALYPGRRG